MYYIVHFYVTRGKQKISNFSKNKQWNFWQGYHKMFGWILEYMLECWVQRACLGNSNLVVRKGLPLFQYTKQETTAKWHRFSAFWLRSKCSICSYQLNIWYGDHVSPSILNLFLSGDEDLELAPALSWVGLVLQYHQDWPTSPLIFNDLVHLYLLINATSDMFKQNFVLQGWDQKYI